MQDNKNRQNSIETSDDVLDAAWRDRQQGVIDAARGAYDWAIGQWHRQGTGAVCAARGEHEVSALYERDDSQLDSLY